MKRKNSPQKKFQEEVTAKILIKTDIGNITEQEFRIIVTKLITGLEKSREDSRESIAAEIKEVKNSPDELKNAINEVQIKWRRPQQGLKRERGKIGELEDKIMEKEEGEKRKI